MSGCTTSRSAIVACAAVSLALTACGSGPRQDASEPGANFSVEVPTASFPPSQSLSQHAHLVITVRNADQRTIPDIAVTITGPSGDTRSQAFGEILEMPGLANPSRPVWIVDQAPGACRYSCRSGAAGAAVTAYANTWALGPLKPGQSATFDWKVTAVKAGTHVVHWQVAAGLNGKAKALLANRQAPKGTFVVQVHSAPAQPYVNNQGQVVRVP